MPSLELATLDDSHGTTARVGVARAASALRAGIVTLASIPLFFGLSLFCVFVFAFGFGAGRTTTSLLASFAIVAAPTMPSAERPFLSWKALTAFLVASP